MVSDICATHLGIVLPSPHLKTFVQQFKRGVVYAPSFSSFVR
jgi:hypothetical protein